MIRNTLKYISTLLVIIVLIFSSIFSNNTIHLHDCQKDNCPICYIILIAQSIINSIISFTILSFIAFIIHYILSITKKYKSKTINNSLITQKVQLNN